MAQRLWMRTGQAVAQLQAQRALQLRLQRGPSQLQARQCLQQWLWQLWALLCP